MDGWKDGSIRDNPPPVLLVVDLRYPMASSRIVHDGKGDDGYG
jgi:hypothetical protein